MIRTYGLYLWVVLVFASSEMLAAWLGIRFAPETLGRLYQYLDPAILENDLARGLYYLHAQPPLFNLFLGLGMKAFPNSHEVAFDVVFGLVALALLLGTAWLMRRAGVADSLNGAACLIFALSPNFLVYRNWLFYTMPVAMLLVGSAIALVRFVDGRRNSSLFFFALLATGLMLTRSVFHPVWILATLAALLPVVPRELRRRLVVAAGCAFLVGNAWLLKNYFVVGSYSGSTWLGMSLAKRWPLSQTEMRELKASGSLPPFWERRPFLEPSELEPFGFFEDRKAIHPALHAPYKTTGSPNFNHVDYVAVSEAMLQGDLYLVRHYPSRYLRRTLTALLLFLQPGPNSVHFLVDYDFSRVHRYRDFLTRYVFLGGEIERPIRMLEPKPNLLVAVFSLALLSAVFALWMAPERKRPLHAYMLVCVVWMTTVANLIEIGENDRMRWEVEPFLVILVAWGASLVLFRRLERPELDPAR